MGKQFGCKYKRVQNLVWVCTWTHSQIEVAMLSGTEKNEEDTKGPSHPAMLVLHGLLKEDSTSLRILVSFAVGRAHCHCFLGTKPFTLSQAGCRKFWKGLELGSKTAGQDISRIPRTPRYQLITMTKTKRCFFCSLWLALIYWIWLRWSPLRPAPEKRKKWSLT